MIHFFSVGRLTCTVISDGQPGPPWEPPLDSFFTPGSGVPTAELADGVAAEGTDRTTLTGGYNCLVVETSAGLAVIDTGLGARFLGYGPAIGAQVGRLGDELAEAGIAASDLAAVVFTHLHQDHVRGATWPGELAFRRRTGTPMRLRSRSGRGASVKRTRPPMSTWRPPARRSRCSVSGWTPSSSAPRSGPGCVPSGPRAIHPATPRSWWSPLASGCCVRATRSTTACSCAIPAGARPGITTASGRLRAAGGCWRARPTRRSRCTPTTCRSPASAR